MHPRTHIAHALHPYCTHIAHARSTAQQQAVRRGATQWKLSFCRLRRRRRRLQHRLQHGRSLQRTGLRACSLHATGLRRFPLPPLPPRPPPPPPLTPPLRFGHPPYAYPPSALRRSTALAQQAVHVFTLLFFVPEVLHRETAVMRELVDKHFVDNWVVPWAHGLFADLTVTWEPYKAARTALDTAISSANARKLTEMHGARLARLQSDLPGLLSEGVVDEDFLMTNQELLMVSLREANATLRWLLLHSHGAVGGRLRPAFDSRAPPAEQVVSVMLDTAELEFVMKKVTNALLESKASRWDTARQEAFERVSELSEFFSGSKVLSKDVKDDNLQKWFAHIAGEISKLRPERPVSTGRKIQQLVAALEEVEQFHKVDVSLQTKQYLLDTRLNLQKMVRTLHVTDQSLMSLVRSGHTADTTRALLRDRCVRLHLRRRLAAKSPPPRLSSATPRGPGAPSSDTPRSCTSVSARRGRGPVGRCAGDGRSSVLLSGPGCRRCD